MAERNTREARDELLQDDAVVVAVVHDHLQGQLLRGCLGLRLFRGGRWRAAAGPVQDQGEFTVGLEGSAEIVWKTSLELEGRTFQRALVLLQGLEDYLAALEKGERIRNT